MAEFDPKRKGLTAEEVEEAWEKSHQRNGAFVGFRITKVGEVEMYEDPNVITKVKGTNEDEAFQNTA